MSLKEQLKKFTDEQLNNEVRRREKQRRGKVLGYRVIHPGDEYNYGSYTDYMIGNKKYDNLTKKMIVLDKKTAYQFAISDGRQVEEIYKNTPKPGVIH